MQIMDWVKSIAHYSDIFTLTKTLIPKLNHQEESYNAATGET